MDDYTEIISNYDPTKNKTKNILTKYECVKLIGLRAQQLESSAEPLIEIKPGQKFDSREIAKQELRERKLPFFIRRTLPNGSKEVWRLDDMIIIIE